jgi:TRAP-type C4-dicarboxylate transport system permease small subunit
LAWISGGLILACSILVTLDVITRKLFRVTYFESVELSQYAFGISIALSLAFAFTQKTHIRIDAAYMLLRRSWRAVLDIVAVAAMTGLAAMFAYYTWSVTIQSFNMPGRVLGAASASSLQFPLIIPQGLWSIGFTWFFLVCVVYLVRAGLALARWDLSRVDALVGIPSAVSELHETTTELAEERARAERV